MKFLNCRTRKPGANTVVALIFAACMLLVSAILGDHPQADTMLIIMISLYMVVSQRFQSKSGHCFKNAGQD